MWWRKRRPEPEPLHRGRIWCDGRFWRYACEDCDYGAGSTEHADPDHWSRNRGK